MSALADDLPVKGWLEKPGRVRRVGEGGTMKAAMRFKDPGDGLHNLRVVKRGQFAVEAVAWDPDSSRKPAELTRARLSKWRIDTRDLETLTATPEGA